MRLRQQPELSTVSCSTGGITGRSDAPISKYGPKATVSTADAAALAAAPAKPSADAAALAAAPAEPVSENAGLGDDNLDNYKEDIAITKHAEEFCHSVCQPKENTDETELTDSAKKPQVENVLPESADRAYA